MSHNKAGLYCDEGFDSKEQRNFSNWWRLSLKWLINYMGI